MIRPAVANVDQALVIFAMDNPKPNFMLLDRFLIMMEREDVPAVICFNKKDLATAEELEFLYETYQSCGYQVILSSALKGEGLGEIEAVLKGKTTVVAGPSGVGKSSLTNSLQEEVEMETGEISRKLKRGKHTTRHAQIIPVSQDTFLVDTPSGYNGGVIRLELIQDVNGEPTATKIIDGQKVSFPYQLDVTGADGVSTGTIYLYEETDGNYQQLGTYTVTFKKAD